MIRVKIASKILFLFDYFQQKKIYIFLKKKIQNNCILVDVGAHHGETIKNFKKYFNASEIHSFEASSINFKVLNNKHNNQTDHKIFLNNFGLSDEKKMHKIKQLLESSSTTISKINENSKYFKKATTTVSFTCLDGEKIIQHVQRAIDSGEGEIFDVKSKGYDLDGLCVSEFDVTWSLKVRKR